MLEEYIVSSVLGFVLEAHREPLSNQHTHVFAPNLASPMRIFENSSIIPCVNIALVSVVACGGYLHAWGRVVESDTKINPMAKL